MQWHEIRKKYPDQWLVIEALEAHTEQEHRCLDQITVVDTCTDGAAALQAYRQLHQQHPQREFYYAHTARTALDIRERHWLGIRRNYGFTINGILGMDLLLHTGAIIDLARLDLMFAATQVN